MPWRQLGLFMYTSFIGRKCTDVLWTFYYVRVKISKLMYNYGTNKWCPLIKNYFYLWVLN